MAGSRAGLKKVTKVVRGKKGSVKRTYWVKAQQAAKGVGGFLSRHKGKIAAGAALAAGAAYLGSKHRGAIAGALHGARHMHNRTNAAGLTMRDKIGATMAGAKVGARIGHADDVMRRAGSAAARTQLKNRAGFVASGLKDAAKAAVSRASGAVKSGAAAVRSGVRRAVNRARGRSNSSGIMIRR